jgi:ATP-binding cassette, subfamily F, member 2
MSAKAKRLARRKAAAEAKLAAAASSSASSAEDDDRTASGVLVSHPLGRDIKIEQFSLSCYGRELLGSTTLELNYGRRYGLIGANGVGKSTMLKALAARDVPIPEHVDITILQEGVPPSDKTAVEAVIEDLVAEVDRLEKKAEYLAGDPDADPSLLDDIYDRLGELEPDTFEARTCELLHCLGFTTKMMRMCTKDFSGGWRMRVALARALLIKSSLLILDQPTSHLDMDACVWLEGYLSAYDRILLIVSHSQDFLNGVCTNTIHFVDQKLMYYGGNYDTFARTKEELEVNQMKAYTKQQADIQHMKDFISSAGTYRNLVRLAQSRQKIIDKMVAEGLVAEVKSEKIPEFYFPCGSQLPPPAIAFDSVAFSYSGKKEDYLYSRLNFGVDQQSKVAIVGPNGAGKSTLFNLMLGDLNPCEGRVSRHPKLHVARYHQHSVDQLDLSKSPIDYMRGKFADLKKEVKEWRGILGRFGVTGGCQTQPMHQLSDGQRARVVFAELAVMEPNMLFLDEPTNSLSMACIDALAAALLDFEGGFVIISHDFRLLQQIDAEVILIDNKTMTKWDGDIQSYKQHIVEQQQAAGYVKFEPRD